MSEALGYACTVSSLDCNVGCVRNNGPVNGAPLTEAFQEWARHRYFLGRITMIRNKLAKWMGRLDVFVPPELAAIRALYYPLIQNGLLKDVLMTGSCILSADRPIKDIDLCVIVDDFDRCFAVDELQQRLPEQIATMKIDNLVYVGNPGFFTALSILDLKLYRPPWVEIVHRDEQITEEVVTDHPSQTLLKALADRELAAMMSPVQWVPRLPPPNPRWSEPQAVRPAMSQEELPKQFRNPMRTGGCCDDAVEGV